MLDRRSFLAGLAVCAAMHPDPVEAQTLIEGRVVALREGWEAHRQEIRATLFLDRPSAEENPLAPLAEALGNGLGALSILKDLEVIPQEDQVHPTVQGLVHDVMEAIGETVVATRKLLEAFVEGETVDPEREEHLRGSLRGLRLGLRNWSTSVGRQQQLETTLAAMEEERDRGALMKLCRKGIKRLQKMEELAEEIAAHPGRTGILEEPNPRVRERAEAGLRRWGQDPDNVPVRVSGGGASGGRIALGILVAGATVVGFLVLVALSCMAMCGGSTLGAVALFLAALGVLGLGIWGTVSLVQPGGMAEAPSEPVVGLVAEHRLAVVGQEGWVMTPVERGEHGTVLVNGSGLVRAPGLWLADADGNARAAGAEALVPGAPMGALVGRVGDDCFFLGTSGAVPPGPPGRLELAVNQGREEVVGHLVARLRVLGPSHG